MAGCYPHNGLCFINYTKLFFLKVRVSSNFCNLLSASRIVLSSVLRYSNYSSPFHPVTCSGWEQTEPLVCVHCRDPHRINNFSPLGQTCLCPALCSDPCCSQFPDAAGQHATRATSACSSPSLRAFFSWFSFPGVPRFSMLSSIGRIQEVSARKNMKFENLPCSRNYLR